MIRRHVYTFSGTTLVALAGVVIGPQLPPYVAAALAIGVIAGFVAGFFAAEHERKVWR